jgi:hypothetical protein
VVSSEEQSRFLDAVQRLETLDAGELTDFTFTVSPGRLGDAGMAGIFDWSGAGRGSAVAAE